MRSKRLVGIGRGRRQETRDVVRATIYVSAMLGALIVYAAV